MVKYYGDMELGRKDEEGVRAFYRLIPPEGGRKNTIPIKGGLVPRLKAIKELEFSETKFERWLKILSEQGLIGTYTGGGIYRVCRQDKDKKETDYYEPIMRELELYWAEQPGREYHLRQRFLRVLDTHHRGAARDGQWTRPDLTLIGGKVLPYLPGKFLDVITFEVKLGMPLDGLYEALAHRRRANFAYVVCVCPKPWPAVKNASGAWKYATPPSEENQAALVAEATRQGIGVILVRQEDDFGLWSELVKPVRHEPDPQHLHDFLEQQCNRKGCLEELREWLDRPSFEMRPVTDKDVDRLALTTKERKVALEMVKKINAGVQDSHPLAQFTELGSDETVGHVRDVLKNAGFIGTVQKSGAIKAVMSLK